MRNGPDFFLFEVHRQVVLYKDSESKVIKKSLSFEPHKVSEETYLTCTRADDSFRQLGRYVWCLPALAIKYGPFQCLRPTENYQKKAVFTPEKLEMSLL